MDLVSNSVTAKVLQDLCRYTIKTSALVLIL